MVVLVAAASMAPAGCSSGPPTAPAATSASQASFLADPAALDPLLRDRFEGSPTMRRLTILPGMVSVEVRDPATPENLDRYTYRDGRWSTEPVRVSQRDIDELDVTTFTLADLDLAVVPGLMSMALEGLALEAEQVTSVSYDRLAGDAPRVYIAIDGLRGSGSLIAGADGSEPHIRRN